MSLTALPVLFQFRRNSETVITLRRGRNVRTKAMPNVSCRLHGATHTWTQRSTSLLWAKFIPAFPMSGPSPTVDIF